MKSKDSDDESKIKENDGKLKNLFSNLKGKEYGDKNTI